MTGLSTNPVSAAALAGLAAYLMLNAGVIRKRLRFRVTVCRVCERPRTYCTCRWL